MNGVFTVSIASNIFIDRLVLFLPISWTTNYVARYKASEALRGSQVKVAGKDVMATWKILTALVVIPVFFSIYTVSASNDMYPLVSRFAVARLQILAHLVTRNWHITLLVLFGQPLVWLCTVLLADMAFESGLRLYPLCLSILRFNQITETRRLLARDIQDLINELGPQVVPDFERNRVVKKGELDRVAWSLDASELLAELFE
jgi:glycerol-3-phosphate O-acyltransferase/dihydroxyacetone phosphate acyltransferase